MSKINFNIRNVLALVIVLSITGIIILGHFVVIPPENKEFIQNATSQYMTVGFAVVCAFYFVASKDTIETKKHEQEMQRLSLQVITEDMKKKLLELGYIENEVAEMTFTQAQEIINSNKKKE